MDIPVLKYLDVLIGLSFVMILGCTVVAGATQVITSSFYLRAQYLRQGLADLLQQLDPTSSAADCQYAAQLIQRHPLVSRPATVFGEGTSWLRRWFGKRFERFAPVLRWLPSGAPATTIHRDELVRILLEWAAGQGVLGNRSEIEPLREKVRSVLAMNGVTAPASTLAAIEHLAVAQERAFPDKPAHLWRTAALIDACPPGVVGKVTGWFDAMVARTSQRFGLQSKLIGGAVSLLVVLALPLDSIDLIRRLADNPEARGRLVEMAREHVERTQAAVQANTAERANLEAAQQELARAKDELTGALQPLQLGAFDIRTEWRNHLPGLLLSWALLALGTPFWYDLLKNLLKLRSVVAQQDDKERADRERAEATPQLAAGPAMAAAATGAATAAGVISIAAVPEYDDEAGDLDQMAAVG